MCAWEHLCGVFPLWPTGETHWSSPSSSTVFLTDPVPLSRTLRLPAAGLIPLTDCQPLGAGTLPVSIFTFQSQFPELWGCLAVVRCHRTVEKEHFLSAGRIPKPTTTWISCLVSADMVVLGNLPGCLSRKIKNFF